MVVKDIAPMNPDIAREITRSCFGKVRHQNRHAALVAAHSSPDASMTAYFCPICLGWHIGHKNRTIRKRKYKNKRAKSFRYKGTYDHDD